MPVYIISRIDPFVHEVADSFYVRNQLSKNDVILFTEYNNGGKTFIRGDIYHTTSPSKHKFISLVKTKTRYFRTQTKDRLISFYDALGYDPLSFVICLHDDNTLCEFYSYENAPNKPLEQMLVIAHKHDRLRRWDMDSDVEDYFPDYFVEEPSSFLNESIQVSKALSDWIKANINLSDRIRQLIISISIETDGHATADSLLASTGIPEVDDKIIQLTNYLLNDKVFSPARHRGSIVRSQSSIHIRLR